jgi:hypothetical protein
MNYCKRPGWWTVEEPLAAINAGYANRMMLEMAPEMTFGVLSPAFKGCEGNFALNVFSVNGCNFLKNNLCDLHGSGYQPIECRFCHHSRKGLGKICHADIEKDWHTAAGQSLVAHWCKITGFWERQNSFRNKI